MNELESLSNDDLLIAIAMVTEELVKRGKRVRIKYEIRQSTVRVKIQMEPFAAKIKTKK